jgi:hypothetical protein
MLNIEITGVCVFRLRLFQDRNVEVGAFEECEPEYRLRMPVLRKNLVGITPQSFGVDIRDAVRPGPTSS